MNKVRARGLHPLLPNLNKPSEKTKRKARTRYAGRRDIFPEHGEGNRLSFQAATC
jgi:hypothetical protein